jgi:arsenate reductase (glutaredoxin)
MIFASSEKAITLIYHSANHLGRQILAYAQVEKLPVHDVDLAHTPVHSVHWAELAQRMGISIKELINTEHPDFMQQFSGSTDLDDHDWLTLLERNPMILKAPIVMKGDKIVMMSNPQDMLHFI